MLAGEDLPDLLLAHRHVLDAKLLNQRDDRRVRLGESYGVRAARLLLECSRVSWIEALGPPEERRSRDAEVTAREAHVPLMFEGVAKPFEPPHGAAAQLQLRRLFYEASDVGQCCAQESHGVLGMLILIFLSSF